jgi:hypothetical protein
MIGGPLHGQAPPRYDSIAIEYAAVNEDSVMYHEMKAIVVPGELAVRVYVCDQIDPRKRYVEFMRDFAQCALSSAGVDWELPS